MPIIWMLVAMPLAEPTTSSRTVMQIDGHRQLATML